MYSSFSIPKRDGTMRQISAPANQLKKIQQKLAEILVQAYIEKGYCHNQIISGLSSKQDAQDILEEWFKRVLIGKITYIGQIKGNNSSTYLSFAEKANELFQEDTFDVSALQNFENIASSNTYILEYSDGLNSKQGSAFYLSNIGLITSYHVTEKGEFFKVYRHYNYPDQYIGMIGKELNEVACDRSGRGVQSFSSASGGSVRRSDLAQ